MWEKGGHFPHVSSKENICTMNGKWHFSICFSLMWLLRMVNISLYFVFSIPMCFCFPYKSCWIVTNPLFTKSLTIWHTLQVFSLVNTCLWVIMTHWYYKNQLNFPIVSMTSFIFCGFLHMAFKTAFSHPKIIQTWQFLVFSLFILPGPM